MASNLIAPEPEHQVLTTLNADGSRRWMRPRVSTGQFLTARRITAYALIALFTITPYVKISGKPAILLDIPARQFTFFGVTLLPTDTILLALFMVGLIISIFLVTALLGRVWCGWACPQTVYMEFLYRPFERLFDGRPGRGGAAGKKRTPVRTGAKYIVFLLASMYLAHTFLAYFVGVEALAQWVRSSPFDHPIAFLLMAGTTVAMMFDFAYFREQTCILACPYGRFQSVLLDRDSLIISYDPVRGEPRGPLGKRSDAGDCVDCGLCVETCPTGIDIRDGLQMECIGCAQCIDACDVVMDKIKKPRGLIRYSSQARIEGQSGRLLRPRVIIYPTILLLIVTLFFVVFFKKGSADVTVLRGLGIPFTTMPSGEVSNQIRLKIANRGDAAAVYNVEVVGDIGARLMAQELPFSVEPGESRTEGILIITPRDVFKHGRREITLRVTDEGDFSRDMPYQLLGPAGPAPTRQDDEDDEDHDDD